MFREPNWLPFQQHGFCHFIICPAAEMWSQLLYRSRSGAAKRVAHYNYNLYQDEHPSTAWTNLIDGHSGHFRSSNNGAEHQRREPLLITFQVCGFSPSEIVKELQINMGCAHIEYWTCWCRVVDAGVLLSF